MQDALSTTTARQDAGCFVGHEAYANLGKQRVACGFLWLLLRVIDHEAALLDPKLFSGLVRRSVVLLKRRCGRQTKQPVALLAKKNDWILQVVLPQHAIETKHKGHTGALYSKNGDRAAGAGMPLFTTALGPLGPYGGVLRSGELRGPILHEMSPSKAAPPQHI